MSSSFSLSLLEAGRCESRGGQVKPASSEEEEPLLARSMLIGQEDPMLLGHLFCKGPNPLFKGSNHLLIPSHQTLGISA